MSDNICQEKVFQSIFVEQAERLRNFMYYKTGNLQQAEDLMQDAFGKLWENCEKVIVAKAKSFLFTVANNLFLNQVEHRKVVLKFENRGKKYREIAEELAISVKAVEKRMHKALAALRKISKKV